MIALSIGEEGHFAARTEEEQAVDPRIDHAVDRTVERLQIELAVGVERNDDGRNNAMELRFGHAYPLRGVEILLHEL